MHTRLGVSSATLGSLLLVVSSLVAWSPSDHSGAAISDSAPLNTTARIIGPLDPPEAGKQFLVTIVGDVDIEWSVEIDGVLHDSGTAGASPAVIVVNVPHQTTGQQLSFSITDNDDEEDNQVWEIE